MLHFVPVVHQQQNVAVKRGLRDLVIIFADVFHREIWIIEAIVRRFVGKIERAPVAIHHRIARLRRQRKRVKPVAGKLGQQIQQADAAALGKLPERFQQRPHIREAHRRHVSPIRRDLVNVRILVHRETREHRRLPRKHLRHRRAPFHRGNFSQQERVIRKLLRRAVGINERLQHRHVFGIQPRIRIDACDVVAGENIRVINVKIHAAAGQSAKQFLPLHRTEREQKFFRRFEFHTGIFHREISRRKRLGSLLDGQSIFREDIFHRIRGGIGKRPHFRPGAGNFVGEIFHRAFQLDVARDQRAPRTGMCGAGFVHLIYRQRVGEVRVRTDSAGELVADE